MGKKLLVIQVAALSRKLDVPGLEFHSVQSIFPAVTCTVQASFRTAAPPARHGMIANGLYVRALRKPMFWEQSSALVSGPRIWDAFRAAGGRVAMLFWQQSLGESADVLLSPAPIHKHHGGMIQDCYCQPADLYARLCERIGRKFDLMHYWGPFASARVGDWITQATAAVLTDRQLNLDLCLTYLPSLDYDLQRFGPDHSRCAAAYARTQEQLQTLTRAAGQAGFDVLVFGDYAIATVTPGGAAYPNRALRNAGLLAVRTVAGMEYPDFHASRAFAMVDHEIAHVYIRNPADIEPARAALHNLADPADILDRPAQARAGLDNPNSGELVLIAPTGRWFAYPWWQSKSEAPDYARHIDIHNKPGYDPCELFMNWFPPGVSQNAGRIGGSHGRTGPGREVAWASTLNLPRPTSLLDLAASVRDWLDE